MPLKVALIDDHPVYRAGLRAVLSGEPGLRVVGEAADAKEGYALADAADPDLVLLDLILPGPDGITVARELLRRDPRRRVLMVSGRVDESTVADAIAAGALGYIGKQQSIGELLAAIRTVAAGDTYLPPGIPLQAVQARIRRGRSGPFGTLSGREREVFEMLVRGFTNEQVSSHLGISRRTVETHRSRILKKLHAHSAVELTRLAARHGLL